VVLAVALPLAVLAQWRPPVVATSEAPSEAEILAIVSDAGSLTNPTDDLYVNAITVQNTTPDGGNGLFYFRALRDGCFKGGQGGQSSICWNNNEMRVDTTSYFPTLFVQSFAADPQGSPMRTVNISGWTGEFPLNSLATCDADARGGRITLNSDGRPYHCDGTVSRKLGYIEPWSSSLDFGAIDAGECQSLTFTATGAVSGEAVACGGLALLPAVDTQLLGMCGISATNTALVHVCCNRLLASCANPGAITFSVTAVR
jgi:hypothetical protein